MRALPEIRDELSNRAETYVTTELPGLWDAVQRRPALHRRVNALLIDRTVGKIPTRPGPLSTMADYTSWASLTDRTYDSRHLPPAPAERVVPPAEDVAALFMRDGEMTLCREVDRPVPLLRAVVRRRLPAQ